MGLCPVSEIKPGAVLVKEVRAKNGRLIFKEGTVLTEKHILVLKSWGITKVYVDDLDKCQDKDFIDLNKELILDFFPPNVLKDSLMKRMVSLSLKWLKKSGKQVIVPFQLVNEKKTSKKYPFQKN